MATDEEIKKLWGGLSKDPGGAVTLYRIAEKEGKQAGIFELEKELLSDATLESAAKVLGWGKGSRMTTIASRAFFRAALDIAKEKVEKS